MPKFSIVIPTYNRAKTIAKAIQSVIAQEGVTEQDWEVIVVDDGSKDNTGDVVGAIEDKRVTYHQVPNGERGAARNFGASKARGTYLNFLDSDDYLLPNHLATAARVITDHSNPEFFHLEFEHRDAEGTLLQPARTNRENGIHANLHGGNTLSCNGVFIRGDIFNENRFREERDLAGSEDYQLWLRLAARYELLCDTTLTSVIVEHDGRSVLGFPEDKLRGRRDRFLSTLSEDEVFPQRYSNWFSRLEGNFNSYIALHVALQTKSLKPVKYLAAAALRDPSQLLRRRTLAIVKHTMRFW